MSIRFRKSKNLGGIGKINLTKGGIGISAGVKGARVGIGPRGTYTSGGIPGTGLYAINYAGKNKKQGSTVDYSINAPTNDPMPIPKTLATSNTPLVILIISAITAFIYLPIGIIGLIGSAVWLYLTNSSDKKKAQNSFNKAKAQYLQGNFEAAIDGLEEALNYEPAANSILPYLANISFNIKDFKRAKYYSQAYLKTAPSDADAVQFNLALAESSLGNLDTAIEILQGLPQEWKAELIYIIALGYAYIENGQPDLALQILEAGPTKKRTMDENMILFRYTLGRAYMEAGQKNKAINQLQKVYTADMNFEKVKELLRELGEEL